MDTFVALIILFHHYQFVRKSQAKLLLISSLQGRNGVDIAVRKCHTLEVAKRKRQISLAGKHK